MNFRREDLKHMGLPYEIDPEDGEILSDEIVGTSRWAVKHKLTFRLVGMRENEAYTVHYSHGATESQEERAWDDSSEVVATLVHKVEKTVTVWEAVS